MKITVKIFQDGQPIAARVFDEGTYRIGRSEFSDITLPHDNISRSHIELRVTEAAVYMTNMSTPARIKVNGKPKEACEISDGDELTTGPYLILIYFGDTLEAAGVRTVQPGLGAESPLSDNPLAEELVGDGGGADGGAGAEPAGAGGQAAFGEPAVAVADAPNLFDQNILNTPRVEAPLVPVEGGGGSLSRGETDVAIRPLIAKLVFTEGPRKGEEIPFETYELTFGRSKKADIYLDDGKLSRLHAKISRVGMGFRLIDLDSRNGTYVNGMRILEHPLTSFDQIELGKTKIQFLVQDVVATGISKNTAVPPLPEQPAKSERAERNEKTAQIGDQTRSVEMHALSAEQIGILEGGDGGGGGGYSPDYVGLNDPALQKQSRVKLIAVVLVSLLALYLFLPSGDKTKVKQESAPVKTTETKVPPLMPKEYGDLSPDVQRMIEGNYNAAIKAGENEQYDIALNDLKKIHDLLPYYKQSLELREQYQKKLKEKQVAEAQEKIKRDDKSDLQIYIQDGLEYLRSGEFDKAAEAFNSAVVIDPNNEIAKKGLKATEAKVRSIEEIPPDRDPEADKRKLVGELFQQAVASFTSKNYQQAIDAATKITLIDLKGDPEYKNQAQQIIDKAKMMQKEEFEPFLIQAKEKYAEGDYNASRDLCEEMLRRDPTYDEAKEQLIKARKQLNKLAKEAYTHGYILESMNRIEEAKAYWNRAKNYVRQGDEYFDKVNKKLEYYQ